MEEVIKDIKFLCDQALYFKVLNPFTGKLYYRWQGYLSNVFNPSGTYKGDS